MNKKYLLLFLVCSSFIAIHAKYEDKTDINNKDTEQCQCYCSFKCGPRDPDQEGDAPFIDPETGICFCQERDRVYYFKHKCHLKHNAKGFNTCCDKKYKK